MARVELSSGITLAVEEFGADNGGVPLVIIHGGPSWSHHYLNPGLDLIGATRHVIAPDLRGCGASSCGLPIEQYQPELAVRDVVDLIESLDQGRVDLMGFSTGGQWAQLLIEARPDLIRRLILASTTAYPDGYEALDEWPEYTRRLALAPVMKVQGDDAERTRAWALNGAPTNIWNLERLDEYRAFLSGTTFTGDWMAPFERRLLHPHRPRDPVGTLRGFGRPILILHGRQDMCFPVSCAERLHRELPTSNLVVIEECGHQAPFEQPRVWAEAIVRFLG